ncbi:MAG: cytochrome c oxidase assembly protein [Caulobacter sp.]|nr:cytochrome c oxidase assembly protein [Caulobacter sp.]
MADRVWSPYCGAGPVPAELWARWNFEPVGLATLVALAVLLLKSSENRLLALAAMAVLVMIFVSPLCALSSALFAARTVHHVLLVAAAAPLIAWALPHPARAPRLAAWTSAFVIAFWFWHAPAAYGSAMANDGVYALMQLSLLITATAAWRAVRISRPTGAVCALLATTVLMGLLGAILTFAPRALYAPHDLTTAAWGLTPLEDQQIAGLIMWIPAAGIYLASALSILAGVLRPRLAAA